MTLHAYALNDTADTALVIATGPDARLVVCRWDAPSGRSLVSIKPEYRDRRGTWHLAHSAVSLPPTVAPQLAAGVLQVAASISGAPTDPAPTAEDRELSRMP